MRAACKGRADSGAAAVNGIDTMSKPMSASADTAEELAAAASYAKQSVNVTATRTTTKQVYTSYTSSSKAEEVGKVVSEWGGGGGNFL